MASLQKEYTHQKLNGVVYTPDFIVSKILDELKYFGSGILGKLIVDPACGDGQFLEEVVKRIVKHSSKNHLKENLECVYGWDIDSEAIEKCKARLNHLIIDKNISINWNITKQNALFKYQKQHLFSNTSQKFDYIVGNPPYIRIQHLDSESRSYIKNYFSLCKNGSTDIYIAFFELAYELLSQNGRAGFITPNSFLRTNTARNLREFFIENKAITTLHNFAAVQIFQAVSTYTAITIFSKIPSEKINYYKYEQLDSYKNSSIDTKKLEGRLFWDFFNNQNKTTTKLKNVADIFTGICTLADKIYVSTIVEEKEKTYLLNNKISGMIEIEKDILKPIIKASKYKNHQKITEMIIFPYENNTIIPEKTMKKEYPLAYEYLLKNKEILDKRDAGRKNPVAWYAFGRSQGLKKCLGRKIIFSPMMKKPAFYICDNEEALIYSGYGIKSEYPLEKITKILNSKELENYINENGADFRDGWKGYNKTVLQEYKFCE